MLQAKAQDAKERRRGQISCFGRGNGEKEGNNLMASSLECPMGIYKREEGFHPITISVLEI